MHVHPPKAKPHILKELKTAHVLPQAGKFCRKSWARPAGKRDVKRVSTVFWCFVEKISSTSESESEKKEKSNFSRWNTLFYGFLNILQHLTHRDIHLLGVYFPCDWPGFWFVWGGCNPHGKLLHINDYVRLNASSEEERA